MSIFKPCVNATPTRAMRCVAGRMTCLNCPEFVDHTMEHEPTGHAWILTTNKYYKRSQPGRYEKGIITFGRTYVMCVYRSIRVGRWTLDVLVDGDLAVFGAQVRKIGIAINAGSDIIKHLIAADINRKPRRETRNLKLETKRVCPVDEETCDLCAGVRGEPCPDAGTEVQP